LRRGFAGSLAADGFAPLTFAAFDFGTRGFIAAGVSHGVPPNEIRKDSYREIREIREKRITGRSGRSGREILFLPELPDLPVKRNYFSLISLISLLKRILFP
jgi:hypothetical protein